MNSRTREIDEKLAEQLIAQYTAIWAAHEATEKAAQMAHNIWDYELRDKLYAIESTMVDEMSTLARDLRKVASPAQLKNFRDNIEPF